MKQGELQALVNGLGCKTGQDISFSDFHSRVRDAGVEIDEGALYELLTGSELLIESNCKREMFSSRQRFFDGAQFRITPLADEVTKGYLVPGHRFMPFLSRTVFPADATLVLPDGSSVPTRPISLPLKQVLPFLHFFGSDGSSEYLILEKDENMESLLPPFEGTVELTVFDFHDYFESAGFQTGDSLMLTVSNWMDGVFEVQAVPADKRLDLAKNREWIRSVAQAFEPAMGELGTMGDCYEQLALTVRNAQESSELASLMINPPMSFADWFNQQKKWAVKSVGDRSLFWSVEDDPLEDFLMESMENPPEPESEMDAWLQKLGLSFSEEEVVAYMLDALFSEEERPDSVLARILEGRSLQFSSAEEQAKFHILWLAKWDEVRRTYSREEDSFAALRSRFLACNDRCLAILRQLDANGAGREIFQNPAFMELNKFSSIISGGLVLFNDLENKEASPFPDDALDHMMVILDDLSDQLVSGTGE
ncbi:MAG: hypothetical protein KAG97_11735, partial [Victivallales bacterium]|nr:hypothetical protein [Victivallales bacterium]